MFFAHMRPSPLRHTVAVLRILLGLSQEEFGKEINLSRRTIQSVELKKLPLTPENALLIEQRFGVSVHWLMAGDTSVDPYFKDEYDRKIPYTKEVYDRIKAYQSSGGEIKYPESTPSRLHVSAIATAHDWFPILAAASKDGKSELAVYYLHKFLDEMREKFGYDAETADKISGKAKLSEPDGSAFLFDYSGRPGALTRIEGKSGFKIRRRNSEVESPKTS